MKLINLLSITSLFILSSCRPQYQYWDLDKFKLVDGALEDGEPVKLVYSSQRADNKEGKRAYIHLIVESQKTQMRVNVLTPVDNGFKAEDGDRVFYFMSEKTTSYKHLNTDLKDGVDKVEELESLDIPRLEKVSRDPRYDDTAQNDYPSIIGVLAQNYEPTK